MNAVAKNPEFKIGGDLTVCRMGYGAMQLTGPGVWGPPEDEENARAVLRRAVELGVNFIDTADVYGPHDNERIIQQALNPYPSALVIGTKAGLVRAGPATPENPGISMNGSGQHIRNAIEGSLTRLGLDCIDLYQLHRVDPAIPIEDTMEVFRALRDEGKIRHIGLSEVGVDDIKRAQSVVDIATVQNVYNLVTRKHEDVLTCCEQAMIAFIPFWPLHSGRLATSEAVREIAGRTGADNAQVSLAWLLQKSPSIILIPGTSSVEHLEQNMRALDLDLSAAEMGALEQLGGSQLD
ncbi:aldo/keto reductase [Rhizobium laguerreae]|uniref:Aldo/keto reductase n=2 Tax=Rhizobium laguerreae TaxID=1076926 RepID=A0AB35FFK1_9HYPH|nr:aldo/keto reductase [Rhizobium laguerreae]